MFEKKKKKKKKKKHTLSLQREEAEELNANHVV